MPTETELCNWALSKVGARRITSITDGSQSAVACDAVFYVLRDAMFEGHPWNFLKKRKTITADARAPAFGFDNAFTLPEDFISLQPKDPSENYYPTDWRIENGRLLTDDGPTLNFTYMGVEKNPSIWSPSFRKAFMSELAVQLCERLTQSNTKKDALKLEAKEDLEEARRVNGQQNPPQDPPEDSYVRCRV